MSENELRLKFNTAYRIISRERKMREHVFRNDPVKRNEKLAEMDELFAIVEWMKNALKETILEEYEQPPLLSMPVKYD